MLAAKMGRSTDYSCHVTLRCQRWLLWRVLNTEEQQMSFLMAGVDEVEGGSCSSDGTTCR